LKIPFIIFIEKEVIEIEKLINVVLAKCLSLTRSVLKG
jgi:hypothetical protein